VEEVEIMSQVSSVQPPPGQSLLLSGVDWETYTRLLRIFTERPGVRLTYDRGGLEIRGPSDCLSDAPFFSALVWTLAEELALPLNCGGSTTLRRRGRRRGIDPDACFWIASAPRMAGRRRLNLRTDPPPDLALDVDRAGCSLNRLSIYAALNVPEVWRLDGDTLTFHVLGADGKYATAAASRSFPLVTPADLLGFLQQARQAGDENAVTRQFRDWVRQRRAASATP
jgi:Uma2 family endonuclease